GGVGVGVGGYVGDAAGGADAGDAVLVGGPGEQAAVTAAGGFGGGVPGHLALVGAGRAGGAQCGAADSEYQRVGGGHADLHWWAVAADRAGVAGAVDDRDVVCA